MSALDRRLVQMLTQDPKVDLSGIKRIYLAHIGQRARAYRELSHRLQGRDISQVILLHHLLINALWLDDILTMFEANGWRIIDPETAYSHPLYQLQPERSAPGQSLLMSMARSLGLDHFDGWERLVDDGDAEIVELDSGTR